MPNKQPSFRERIQRLEQAARCLDDIAATIADEVAHMEAAATRFTDRRSKNDKRRARE